MPNVGIITAAYKTRPDHLQAALRSACLQTHEDICIHVVDDSPTDCLRSVVESLGDPRIDYRHNVPALGPARNHRKALDGLNCEYVVILNHDDLIAPTFVAKMLAPLEADPRLALAFCDHWIIDDQGTRDHLATDEASRRYGRATLAAGCQPSLFDLLLHQTIPMVMGCLFRRRCLSAPLPDIAGPAYDLWLTYLIARGGGGAYFVPERLSSWRSHPANQTTQRSIALLEGAARCWSALAKDPQARAVRAPARARAAAAYRACSLWYLQQGRTQQARQAARLAMDARLQIKNLSCFALSMLPLRGRRAE